MEQQTLTAGDVGSVLAVLAPDTRQAVAKMNQIFVCLACAKAFSDRAATQPVEIDLRDQVTQIATTTPHPKYPDDPELATVSWVDVPGAHIVIPGAAAGPCCARHTRLCSSTRLRFRTESPVGKPAFSHVVGAEHLE